MIEKIVQLISEQRYNELKAELIQLNVADIADIIEILPESELMRIFRLLPKSMAADVFAYLSIEVEQALIMSLTDKEAANILDNLFADDATDLLEEMPASVVHKLLSYAKPETRKDINHLLRYPDSSAGSIMTVEFINLRMTDTVDDAFNRIRKECADKETIEICYVTDGARKLIGIVTIRNLILAEHDTIIENIMDSNVISVDTLMDQEEVSMVFQKYDFTSMPVVDSENRLVGIITVDDIVDIMRDEATEDIEKMAAITPSEKPYLKTSVFDVFKQRIPWLMLLMVSATFTGKIIQSFEGAIASCVILTSFIPMLTDTGGNAGSQSSVTIIRSLSLGDVRFADIFKIIWKELRVSLLCGVSLAIINIGKMMLIDSVTFDIALVVSLTLVVTVFIAKLVGCTLPLVAKKLGFDPAVMASPFLTTIVDALALIVYFNIASGLLNL
ncbi:MAG: magnesium transporter [Clostridia bacterium]